MPPLGERSSSRFGDHQATCNIKRVWAIRLPCPKMCPERPRKARKDGGMEAHLRRQMTWGGPPTAPRMQSRNALSRTETRRMRRHDGCTDAPNTNRHSSGGSSPMANNNPLCVYSPIQADHAGGSATPCLAPSHSLLPLSFPTTALRRPKRRTGASGGDRTPCRRQLNEHICRNPQQQGARQCASSAEAHFGGNADNARATALEDQCGAAQSSQGCGGDGLRDPSSPHACEGCTLPDAIIGTSKFDVGGHGNVAPTKAALHQRLGRAKSSYVSPRQHDQQRTLCRRHGSTGSAPAKTSSDPVPPLFAVWCE